MDGTGAVAPEGAMNAGRAMESVVVRRTLDASPAAVWALVRRGDGLERWFPPVTACRLEGAGAGARRTCVIDGHALEERLVTVDDAAMLFQYRVERQALLPVGNVLGTMHVQPAGGAEGGGQCAVTWVLNFEPDDAAALPVVRAAVAELYAAGLAGLETAARREAGAPEVAA